MVIVGHYVLIFRFARRREDRGGKGAQVGPVTGSSRTRLESGPMPVPSVAAGFRDAGIELPTAMAPLCYGKVRPNHRPLAIRVPVEISASKKPAASFVRPVWQYEQ